MTCERDFAYTPWCNEDLYPGIRDPSVATHALAGNSVHVYYRYGDYIVDLNEVSDFFADESYLPDNESKERRMLHQNAKPMAGFHSS